MRIAVLDDWQSAARSCGDWTELASHGEISFFEQPFEHEDDAARRLEAFEIILAMRERTPFPARLVARLPRLRLFCMTGRRARLIDTQALCRQGVVVCFTGGGDTGAGTAEMTLALMLACARELVAGDAGMRAGRFQSGIPVGLELAGRTLGLIGLGKIGSLVARYGRALGMEVVAWSPHLTPARAEQAGAVALNKASLLARSDVVSLHLVLSDATRGIIGKPDLELMKHGAILVNTSRADLIDEPALVDALHDRRLFAALDVHAAEPVRSDAAILRCPNTLLTPHLGYATRENMETFYRESIENALAYLRGSPIRVLDSPITPQHP